MSVKRASPAGRHARPVPDLGQRVRAALACVATHRIARAGRPRASPAFLRFWQLDAVGFNSDEAVYTGTAASIAGNPALGGIFPIFRAHPVLFQMLLSLLLEDDVSDWTARALPAVIGVCTVAVTYLLGRRLYGHGTGLIGALILAVMTYHVVVTRQVLLDGLMTLCATGVLYCIVRYSETSALRWLLAAGAMMGATILAKETSIVLVGGLYAYFALTPAVRTPFSSSGVGRPDHDRGGAGVPAGVDPVRSSPVSVRTTCSGSCSGGRITRLDFYLTVVPSAVGFLVLAAAIGGLVWLRTRKHLAGKTAHLLVPGADRFLHPVAGQGLPVPPADRARGRHPGRTDDLPARDHRAIW